MIKKNWTVNEERILKGNFVDTPWEEMLDKLPHKTDKQILRKAHKLGLKKKNEKIRVYYDKEKSSWIEEERCFVGDSVFTLKVSYEHPSGEEHTYAEVQEEFSQAVSYQFYELFVKEKYIHLLRAFGINHNKELFNFCWDSFVCSLNGEELPKIEDHINEITESIKLQKKQEAEQIMKEIKGNDK
ncbi:hypothetical protein AB1283_04300 [Bacillus sp. S13(2024)]|uniref:hypothetical protein n=1 Tax=unclassified Bacillus (in: firmicutes) TaxID=185979 RepID=UPI003D1D8322